MIRIAFVKFVGLSAGGTEKFLQTIAANLPQDRFIVDYFYCDAAPFKGIDYSHADTSPERLNYMQQHDVNLVKFKVGQVDATKHTRDWLDTDFWQKFNERNYDIIQTGRAGFPEYPFYKIKHTPIVDSLHLFAGVDNQFNIARVMHLSQWSAKKWIFAGGDKSRVVLVSHPMDIPNKTYATLREKLSLQDKFIYGFHQRADDRIFSPIPLQAYKLVENSSNAFILMGGGQAYRNQAQALGLKNIFFLDHSADPEAIYSFLATLDVYAHGRKDGEINSTAMAEAMYFGLPIVSHYSKINNGHIECIGQAGKVLRNAHDYSVELIQLNDDRAYYDYRSTEAKRRFANNYELNRQMEKIMAIYQQVVTDPFPHPLVRKISQLRLKYILFYSFKRVFDKIKRTLLSS